MLNIFKRADWTFIGLLILAKATILTAVITPTFLEKAARVQCFNRDWPAAQHQQHITFCHTHGYEVSKLGPGY